MGPRAPIWEVGPVSRGTKVIGVKSNLFIRILNWRGKCCKGHWGDKRRHLNKRRRLDTDTAPALNSHSGDRTGYVRACPSSQEMSSEVRRTLPLACYSSVTWRLKTATIYCVSRSCGVTGLSQAALLLVRSWLELLTWLHSVGSSAGPARHTRPRSRVWGG